MKPERTRRKAAPTQCRLSARTIALADAFDGPPRQGMAATSLTDPILREILRQIAPAFDALARSETQHLLETGLVCIAEVYRRAKAGEADAAPDLVRLAAHAVRLLDQVADHQLPAIRDLARTGLFWPSFLSTKPELIRLAQQRLHLFELGEDCSINVKPRSRWSLENFATQYVGKIEIRVKEAWTLLKAIKADGINVPTSILHPWYRAVRALPPLHKGTAKRWFEQAIWPLVMAQHSDQPQLNERLRKLGLYRRGHTTTARPGSKTEQSNIRDGIKTKLWQAFKNILASAPTSQHHAPVISP